MIDGILKLENIGSSVGNYDKLNYFDSIAALFIIYLGTTIKSLYYKHVFILNGLTSCIAHSPLMKNMPILRTNIGNIDGLTIWYSLLMSFFRIKYKLNDTICIVLLYTVIILNYLSNNIINIITNKLFIFSIILLIYQIKDKLNLNILLYVLPAILTKIYEKTLLYDFKFEKLYMHSIWHILGTVMFIKLVVDLEILL